MSTSKRRLVWLGIAIFCLLMLSLLGSCGKKPQVQRGGVAEAAIATYVAPGDLDEYYLFASGGHSGQVYVYGIPSGRHISTIPVFTPYPATGYGFDDDSKKMLGDLTWGDAHHPGLSETAGDYDGRWLFINDMPSARIARIDLADFKTKQIYGPIPNVSAAHACPFPTPNTEYVFAASRFSTPVPDVDRTDYLLCIGANPLVSNGSLLTAPNLRGRLQAILDRGGKIVVVDPHRAGHELAYHPGEANFRRAHVLLVNKVDSAPVEGITRVLENAAANAR